MPHMRDDALAHCARIREVVLHSSGGWGDIDALGRISQLCDAATRDADDAECAGLMRTAHRYAADLYSSFAHENWATDQMSGEEFLRLQILRALDAFRDRLMHLALQNDPPARGRCNV